MRLSLAVVASLLVLSCGPVTDSFSCQNATANACTTFAISGGTWTTKECGSPQTPAASCPTTGVVGRCVIIGDIAGVLTCPANATCTSTAYYLTGADATAAQAACATRNGTWTAG